jgi:hypothetical protein
MVGTWAEFGLIAPIAFGNASVRLVILIGLRTLTVLFLFRFTQTNVANDAIRISRKVCCSLKLHHHWQQTFGNAQNDQIAPTRLSERSACSTPFCTDRSDNTFRTHPQLPLG